jgi:hypothetical protein
MMDLEAARTLRELLRVCPVAALGTFHRGHTGGVDGAVCASAGETSLIIHVSALATHTVDMQAHPRVTTLHPD